ncbi:MAG TPA: LamG-like jellyroll fold domain-containing protein [Bacteroidota bacterium]|nr:LamG-like jellyroll fold domain-containing protein [Bacteroidota bacterium]
MNGLRFSPTFLLLLLFLQTTLHHSSVAQSVYGEYQPDVNTLLLMHFHEVSGDTVHDASANAFVGTANGTTVVSGRFGNARSFNGSSDVINTNYNGNFGTGPFTVEFWVNLNALSSPHQNIIGNRFPQDASTWWIGVYNDGRINVDGGNGGIVSAPGHIVANRWYHIAVTRDAGNTLRVYKNGILVASGTQSGNYNGGTNTSIGAIYNGGEHVNGVIDEVRISNVPRSPSEFNLQLPPKNFSASVNGQTVTLTWQNGGGSVSLMRYRVYRGSNAGSMTLIDSTSSTSYQDSGRSPGSSYTYRVSAVDSTGFEGEMSAAVSVTIFGNTFHVSTNGNDANNGSVSSPWRNIQTALNRANVGDVIKIAAGTYAENLITKSKVFLYGGFTSAFESQGARDLFRNRTILRPLTGTIIVDSTSSVIDGFVLDGSGGATSGIRVRRGHSVISHNLIHGFTSSFGPGIEVDTSGAAAIKNNTLANNRLSGGGVIFYATYIEGNSGGGGVFENNILFNNDVGIYISASGVQENFNCSFGHTYRNYDGGASPGPNDIQANPRFVNQLAADYRLKSSSPCVDAGNPADPVGAEPEPNGGRINMGVYGGTLNATSATANTSSYVSTAGSDTNPGTLASPFKTIQHALNNAIGDTIRVASGTYAEGLLTSSRTVLLGGYNSTFSSRDIFANKTIILGVSSVMLEDAQASTIDGFIFDGRGIPTDAGIKAGPGSVVTHNVIRRVSASSANGIETTGGAQILNNTIVRCVRGIEISSGTGSPLIKNNIIAYNSFGIVHNASGLSQSVRPYNDVFSNSISYAGFNTSPGQGDISLNPLFNDTSTAVLDYRFPDTSPCVNAGDPLDPVGEEPFEVNGRIDMGAYGGTKHGHRGPEPVLPGEYRTDVNTVLLLHMNEPSGTIVGDVTPNQNHGTAQGTTISDGKFGKSRSFSTTNERITVPHSASLNFGTGSYTLEAWINTLNHTNIGGHPHHKRGTGGIGWFTALTTAGEVALAVNNDPNPSGAVGVRKINDGKWHHIAAVITQTTLSIYIDGVLDATAAVNTQGSSDNDGELLLGWQGGNPNPFKGLIDEVRISNIARSPNEFNLQLPPKNLTASTSGGTINLSWQNGGGGVPLMRYRIYQGTDSTNLSKIDSTTATSRSVTNLTPGTRHFFRVTSVDSTGFESVWSFAAHDSLSSDVAAPASPLSPAISPSGWTNTDRFTISWTNPTDESGIAKVWYRVNSAPSTLNPGTSINLLGATSFQITVGAPGTHTIYFYLEDGIGNKNPSSYVTVTAQFDNIKPTVSHDTTGVLSVTVQSGQVIGTLPSITATASRGDSYSPLSSMQLQWRKSNEVGFPRSQSFPGFTNSSIQFNAQQFVTAGKANGVDYRIVVMDAAGNVTMTPTYSISVVVNDPTVSPFNAPAASSLPVSEIVKAYRIFSVPYDLNDKRPSSFLPQSLGDHAENGVPYVRWRFVRVLTDGSLQDYEQFKDLGVVEPGKAFFLIVRKPATIVVGAGKIVKSQVMNDVGISVNAGWNLIGNPLLTNLHADSLTVTSGTIQTRAYFDGAGTSGGWVVNSGKADTLRSWEGLAVRFSQNTTLRFKSIGVQPGVEEERGMPLTVESAVFDPMAKNKGAWSLKLSAFRQDNGMKDEGNLIGMIRPAKRGWDANDWYHPPLVGEKNVALYLMNEDGALMRDLRPVNEEGESWDFNVVTGDAGSRITLRINGPVGDLPLTFRKYLIDLDEKMAYDVDQRESVEMTTKKEGRWFRLVVGTSEYVQKNSRGVELVPSTARIFQNYPNPFNPETIIRYTVPEGASQYRVSLKIFNLLGQEIASLVEEEQLAGYYEAKFHAGRFASGPYFYRLTISDGDRSIFSDVKRMLLVK